MNAVVGDWPCLPLLSTSVCPPTHSVDQLGVYEHIRPAVEAALSGLNSTIMAYGQTGSGKSHTLFGGLNPDDAPPARATDGTSSSGPSTLEGVTSRAVHHLFSYAAAQAEAGKRVAISASLLEVYNEAMQDLLLPVIPAAEAAATAPRIGGSAMVSGGRPPLSLRENEQKEVFVKGLTEVRGGATRASRRRGCRTVMSRDMCPRVRGSLPRD